MAKKDKRLVRAKEVVKDPTLPDNLPGQHILLHDTAASGDYANLLIALDLLTARDWQVVGLTALPNADLCALLRRGPDAAAPPGPWPY